MKRSPIAYGIIRALQNIDIFGRSIPGFNIDGKNIIKTPTGGLLSLLIPIIVLIFAGLKFIHMWERYNPQVSQVTRRHYYTS